jgi:hypothetical protein
LARAAAAAAAESADLVEPPPFARPEAGSPAVEGGAPPSLLGAAEGVPPAVFLSGVFVAVLAAVFPLDPALSAAADFDLDVAATLPTPSVDGAGASGALTVALPAESPGAVVAAGTLA